MGVDKIILGEGGVGTRSGYMDERRNIPEEAPEPTTRHAPSLAYASGRHPNASFPPW